MTEQDASELRGEELKERIRHLESKLAQSNAQLTQILEILESQGESLRAQQTSIARLERIQMEMITGRAWRALRAATDLVRRFVPGSRRPSSDSVALTKKLSYLVCDEPLPRDKTPRSGIITVRGWCLCEGGVDHVQVFASNLEPMQAKPSIARPDVKKTHSDLDTTGRSGFAVNIDSAHLP